MKRPLIPGVLAHTERQLAMARARGQANWSRLHRKAHVKAYDVNCDRERPALADFGTHALVECDADGRFCPRRQK